MTIAKKLEERWTPTRIQAAFVLNVPQYSSSRLDNTQAVILPLLNFGWSFTLSLTETPARSDVRYLGSSNLKRGRSAHCYASEQPCNWVPAGFLFQQHGSTIPWGNASLHVQLSLATDRHNDGLHLTSEERILHSNVESDSTVLSTMDIVLENSTSAEVPITTSCTLSFLQPTKVWLTVTISYCPFIDGFFQGVSNRANEAESHAWLVRRSGDRLLSRSLATGKLFDVTFLTRSVYSTGNAGKLHQTHVSLSVLKEHINPSSVVFREEWASALAVLDHRDNSDTTHVHEISCPSDYEYELDSDFEDEDEALFLAESCVSESPPRQHSGTSSFASLDLNGVGGQGSFDNQHEELIKGPEEPSRPSSAAVTHYERAILVKFAAHRTWYAFLWYCYTGHLEFGKLKSQLEPGSRRLRVTHLEDGPPPCSPKSMYRLADLVDDKDLKAKALEAIKKGMTKGNILEEMFSVFTSKYPDVREVQLGVLMQYWRSPEVKKAFLRMMSKFGNMPHAEPALSALYDRLEVPDSY